MGGFDPKVMVYDDFYTLVDRNDDVDPNSRGAIYTSGKIFIASSMPIVTAIIISG